VPDLRSVCCYYLCLKFRVENVFGCEFGALFLFPGELNTNGVLKLCGLLKFIAILKK
jgi:hypothetical protein